MYGLLIIAFRVVDATIWRARLALDRETRSGTHCFQGFVAIRAASAKAPGERMERELHEVAATTGSRARQSTWDGRHQRRSRKKQQVAPSLVCRQVVNGAVPPFTCSGAVRYARTDRRKPPQVGRAGLPVNQAEDLSALGAGRGHGPAGDDCPLALRRRPVTPLELTPVRVRELHTCLLCIAGSGLELFSS
jgi:hypothetical protein